jgi:hypothetical protein
VKRERMLACLPKSQGSGGARGLSLVFNLEGPHGDQLVV